MATDSDPDNLAWSMDEELWPLALHIMRVEQLHLYLWFRSDEIRYREALADEEHVRLRKAIKAPKEKKMVPRPSTALAPGLSATIHPSTYGYVRASSRDTPVWKWLETRFRPRYPGIGVAIYGNDEKQLRGEDFLESSSLPQLKLWSSQLVLKLECSDEAPTRLCELLEVIKGKCHKALLNITDTSFLSFIFGYSWVFEVRLPMLRLFFPSMVDRLEGEWRALAAHCNFSNPSVYVPWCGISEPDKQAAFGIEDLQVLLEAIETAKQRESA